VSLQAFGMLDVLQIAVGAVMWGLLVASGFVYFRVAALDPHNPAQLPGRRSRLFSSVLAATALLASPFFQDKAELFFDSLAVGTVLGPGLNDPYHSRRAEDPSWLSRKLTSIGYSVSGGWILKIVAAVVGFISSLVWAPGWLPIMAMIAGASIVGRVGVFLSRGSEGMDQDLEEMFGSDVPPLLTSLNPKGAAAVREASEKEILAGFPPPLGRTIVASKKADDLLTWHRPNRVIPRMLLALLGLSVWTSIAGVVLFDTETVAINAGNYDGASGIIFGVVLSILLGWVLPRDAPGS